MRKLKEQGYEDMHPFILDLQSRDSGALLHCSVGNRLGVSRKFDESDNLVKHAEVQAETKWCKEVHYQSTVDLDLPELVAFLQDTSAAGERHPPHGKCRVQGCELDRNAISCLLDSDTDSGSQATRHALWTETSASYAVKFEAQQVLHKDRVEIRSPGQAAMEKKADVHVKDEIPVKHISPEVPPVPGHIPGETSAAPISAASYVAAAMEHDVPPNINQRRECPGSSEFADTYEVESKLMLGSVMPGAGTRSGQILVKKQVCGNAYFSAASSVTTTPTESDTVPYFRTISFRSKSNSSTTSSTSFSFPLLPFEWNGSPIKMAKANQTKLREQQSRPRWTRFVCCKQKYISQCDSDDEIAHKIMK
ncbi:hypothetical protein ACJRO7_009832 [Eucalyptus globulus]|uniref:Uncharacterized protein n=1 Tax=Eucalyptus globulus TaxID=34317 RepID=A0ABD3LDK7_EUCGL